MGGDEFRACIRAIRRGQLNLTAEDARDFWELLLEMESLGLQSNRSTLK